MHSTTLLVSLMSASTVLAMPWGSGANGKGGKRPNYPVNMPPSTLPAPASNMALKNVVLGYGTQNYTCAATPNAATAPASNGAAADLYDVQPLLSLTTGDQQVQLEKALPILALQLGSRGYSMSQLPGPAQPQQIGKHFFAPPLIPTFTLFNAHPSAQIGAKKLANVAAPSDAYAGWNNEGAVDWLQLGDNGLGYTAASLGGGNVYRVETAGGKAPATCEGQTGDVLVHYAALYFFYGP